MSQSPLYEIEILPSGKLAVSWETADGTKQKEFQPDELEDGVRELVKTFINKE